MRLLRATIKGRTSFFCDFGTCCTIEPHKIVLENYPFKPSKAYPYMVLNAHDIHAVVLKSHPPQLCYKGDWIFIAVEKLQELTVFVETNAIRTAPKNWVWDYILEPFLDTAHTKEEAERTLHALVEKGMHSAQVAAIRKEVSQQMYRYNFDTMLWEWVSLGLLDVLQAMRVAYSDRAFEEFYNKAMAIENEHLLY